ncbi:hypothetical protein HBA_0913 [Sodalis endosymbiont of Henestaris halophilus]|nr:hypothetical protein HBA_0913 [Sodalis endosymbiont of Henestaris halophilus]
MLTIKLFKYINIMYYLISTISWCKTITISKRLLLLIDKMIFILHIIYTLLIFLTNKEGICFVDVYFNFQRKAKSARINTHLNKVICTLLLLSYITRLNTHIKPYMNKYFIKHIIFHEDKVSDCENTNFSNALII